MKFINYLLAAIIAIVVTIVWREFIVPCPECPEPETVYIKYVEGMLKDDMEYRPTPTESNILWYLRRFYPTPVSERDLAWYVYQSNSLINVAARDCNKLLRLKLIDVIDKQDTTIIFTGERVLWNYYRHILKPEDTL